MFNECFHLLTYTKDDFKIWYLGIIGFFYAGQGFALASMVLLLPLYILNELHIESRASAVALSAMMIFPWYIKFVFGLITDNFPIGQYRRKPYLVFATVFSLIGWTTIGISDSVSPFFILSGLLLATGSALGDSVIDGLSVEITPPQFTGRLQGINWGSRGLGIGSAGIISANIVDQFGWQEMFLVAGTFGVIITVITLVLPEIGASQVLRSNSSSKWQVVLGQLTTVFRKERTKYRVGYFLFSGFALSILLQLTLIMETEFEYSFDLIGLGALSFALGTFFGAIINGILVDQSDTLFGFIGLSIAYAISILIGVVFVSYRDFPTELMFFFIIGVFGGAYEGYQLKVIQDETTENLESTIFAIYTGISNVGQFAFGGLFIVILADLLDLAILITMQFVLLILVFAGIFLYKLKFEQKILDIA